MYKYNKDDELVTEYKSISKAAEAEKMSRTIFKNHYIILGKEKDGFCWSHDPPE